MKKFEEMCQREARQEELSQLHEIVVKVVHCRTCDYVDETPAPLCRQQGHDLKTNVPIFLTKDREIFNIMFVLAESEKEIFFVFDMRVAHVHLQIYHPIVALHEVRLCNVHESEFLFSIVNIPW